MYLHQRMTRIKILHSSDKCSWMSVVMLWKVLKKYIIKSSNLHTWDIFWVYLSILALKLLFITSYLISCDAQLIKKSKLLAYLQMFTDRSSSCICMANISVIVMKSLFFIILNKRSYETITVPIKARLEWNIFDIFILHSSSTVLKT